MTNESKEEKLIGSPAHRGGQKLLRQSAEFFHKMSETGKQPEICDHRHPRG
jgi:hypothetical protein